MGMRFLATALGILLAASGAAEAKVAFTGYGDLRFNTLGLLEVGGTPTALGPSGLNIPASSLGKSESRGFSADAIGLFATTELNEHTQFLVDFTYRGIGQNVATTRIQYAYVNWTPREDWWVKGGKVTLPFGYFNENRFYPFDRHQVNPPVFINSILGLPIADWGVVAGHAIPVGGGMRLKLDLFSVNGYGSISATNPDSLRSPTVPGGLNMSANLKSADNNHEQSYGGRLRLTDIGGTDSETGFSYYRGVWNTAGTEPLQMMNAHVHARAGIVDFVWEGLRVDVKGDQGFGPALASPSNNWRTLGHFGKAAFSIMKVRGMPLTPFLCAEDYTSKRAGSGGPREALSSASAGASLDVSPNLRLKAEYLHLYYRLPVESAGAGEHIWLKADLVTLAAVVTF